MHLARLRSSMAFIVNNLQFHLQVDVIDSLFTHLRSTISQAKDFQSVVSALDDFVGRVITQTNLHNRAMRNGFDKILRLCLRFAQLATRFADLDHEDQDNHEAPEGTENSWRADNVGGANVGRAASGPGGGSVSVLEDLDQAIATLSSSFSTDVRMLFSLLRREKSSLLARLDFNGHFTALARGQSFYESTLGTTTTTTATATASLAAGATRMPRSFGL
jgi:hypothetical protein